MHWRTVVLSILCPLLSACVLEPRSVPPQVSSAGYTSLDTRKVGGWIYLINDTYVPGATVVSGSPTIMTCESGGHEIEVEYYSGSKLDLEDTCRNISAAATEAERWFPGQRATYSIVIIPEGRSIYVRRRSLGFRSFHMTLAMAQFKDREKYAGNQVSLVAHESFHALGRLQNDRRGKDEQLAYYAGLCAQLKVVGSIPESALPGSPLTEGVNVPIKVSSAAAYDVRLEVYPLLRDGVITENSDGGQFLAQRCESLRHRVQMSVD